MLYFIYGSRTYTKKELQKVRDALLNKRPNALSLRLDSESSETIDIEDLAQGKGLFEERYLVELDQIFGLEIVLPDRDLLAKIKDSENIFFVLEEKLPRKTLDLLKEYSEKTIEEISTNITEKGFSAFSLADALGERNKQRLWVLLREAIERGYALEEIQGILFWQAKMIVLAHKTNFPTEAGVKPFPYNKAKRFAQNFTLKESEDLLHIFTQALVLSREKNIPLEHTLERGILSL